MVLDSSKDKLIKELKTAAINYGGNVRRVNSSREEAWTALHTNISAKLKYHVSACTLTDIE